MLVSLILAASLYRDQPIYPSWLVLDRAGCAFEDPSGNPIPKPIGGANDTINTSFTVNSQKGCSNPTIIAVLDATDDTLIVLDMSQLDSYDGGNYEMNLQPGGGFAAEVGFSSDLALGGNVSVQDGYQPDSHVKLKFGLKPGKKVFALSKFRVRRLSGQATTTFVGNGTIYHVCADAPKTGSKAFDLDVTDGSVYVTYVDNEGFAYNDTVYSPKMGQPTRNIMQIVTDDQDLLMEQWEQTLSAYPDDLLTSVLQMKGKVRGAARPRARHRA